MSRPGRLLLPLAILGLGLALACGQIPDTVLIDFDHPTQVTAEQPVAWVVSVYNGDEKPHTLRDLDVASELTAGVFFTDSEPPWVDSFLGQATGEYNYKYMTELQPGESTEILLLGTARKPGEHIGTLAVCLDNAGKCREFPVRVVVQPADQAEPGPPSAPGAPPHSSKITDRQAREGVPAY
jgi:hypothetical protein